MTIEINDSKTILDIQGQFSGNFPFLKLEFFMRSHGPEEPSNEMPCLPELTIGELRTRHVLGLISITPERQTGSVEREFEDRFDLHVQVYRRQADQWIQTTGTDILTLQEQNAIAMDSAILYNPDHQATKR